MVDQCWVAVEAPRKACPAPPLEEWPAADDAGVEALMAREVERPFDLARPPLWRALLARRGPTAASLVLVLSHCVADGASCGVLLREVALAYGAAVGCGRTEVPAALPYAQFAGRYSEGPVRGALEGQWAFWRERLRQLPLAPVTVPEKQGLFASIVPSASAPSFLGVLC